jgi:hypothetical protein
MKNCSKCNKDKEFKFFYKKKLSKDGYTNICISCRKEYNKINKENTNQYYVDNKEKFTTQSKKYYLENIEKHNKYVMKYQKENPDKKKKATQKWQKNNREYFKKWRKFKYDNDPSFRLRITLGNRLNEVLKKSKTYKTSNIIELLGCTLNEVKLYLEKQFKPEMTWKNHGKIWEVDHIKSCSKFDLTKIENQQKCFHFTNLKPLFKTTNISKCFGYSDQIGNRNKSSN